MQKYHVLNLGAGVQSTALYLMARDGRLPCDVAVFADTGEEPAAVYRHLQWLLGLGSPPILIRSAGRLGDDLQQGRNSTRQRFASIPAFTAPDHRMRPARNLRAGRVRRQCTAEYKIEVIERTIRREILGLKPRQRIPRGVVVNQYFGITLDEAGRAARARRRFEKMAWARPVYPLLDLGWTRQDCLRWLRERVPHAVPRSACVFCPFHTNREWTELRRTDPAGWSRAVAVDEALRRPGNIVNRGLDQKLYLHRSCVPLASIDFDTLATEAVNPMTVGECQGMCGV